MSKRFQERKTGEEPAVAKPRSTCVMSRNLLNQKRSTGKLAQNKAKNPVTCSQERHEDTQGQGRFAGNCNEVMVCDSSGICKKLQRGVENQLERTRLDYHNVQISDYRYVDKIFEILRQKLRLGFKTLDAKTNVLIWGLFMLTTMKSSVHLGLQYQENFDAHKNTNFEELKTSFSPWMRSTLCHDQASANQLSIYGAVFRDGVMS